MMLRDAVKTDFPFYSGITLEQGGGRVEVEQFWNNLQLKYFPKSNSGFTKTIKNLESREGRILFYDTSHLSLVASHLSLDTCHYSLVTYYLLSTR